MKNILVIIAIGMLMLGTTACHRDACPSYSHSGNSTEMASVKK